MLFFNNYSAGVAELVDALDLGSSGESRGGSSPSARTRSTSVTGGHSRRLPTRLPDGPVAKEGCGIGEPSLAEEKGSMKISETRAEGLIREYAIVISAAEIDEQVAAKLAELATTVNMPGFRPGKVPVNF